MTDSSLSQFSAVDATLGYLYQIRSALLWTLRRLRTEPDFLVSIETLDDVTFEAVSGAASELLQTKHHRKNTASLTDASPDLWKTIRIWFEGRAAGVIPATVNLFLVTTGKAPVGSASWYLRTTNRDVAAAIESLNATAHSSSNQVNANAYKVYLGGT